MYYVEEIQIEKAKELLESCGLSIPSGIDYTAGVYNDNGKLVATGSLKGDMIQGIAVDPAFQGEDLTAKVFTHLIQSTDRESLYLFTKPDKVQQFVGLGMRHVATARPYAGLLEWGKEGVKEFQEYISQFADGQASCLVMNCNPFTLGQQLSELVGDLDYTSAVVVQQWIGGSQSEKFDDPHKVLGTVKWQT